MERRQINAPAAKLRGTVAVLKKYIERENMDVIKERERERKEPWMIKEREHGCNKGGSERISHSPITAVE